MTNKKYNYSAIAFFATLILLFIVGCSRDLEELELASYPTTPEVFIDGFSAGMDFYAYGGSKVTAFEVDTDIKYRGTSSMRFDVPSAQDPEGAYAGGTFVTSVERDLSGYDALTFWARASQNASLDLIGYGNGLLPEESPYQASISGVEVNTTWQKFYVPIADPSKLTKEGGLLYFAEAPEQGKGYSFWLDEVQFEKLGTIAYPRPSIMEQLNPTLSAQNGDTVIITGTSVIYNIPTGTDQSVEITPAYFSFSSSDPSVASVNSDGKVSVIGAGTTVISATLAGVEATGSLTIQSSGEAVIPQAPAPRPTISPDSVISMFSNAYTNVTVDTWNPFWQFSTAQVEDIKIGDNDVKHYTQLNFVGILTESAPINAEEMTHFHIDIWTPNSTDPPASFKVLLADFGSDASFGGGDDSSFELSFTSPLLKTEEWVSIDIPLSDFVGLTSRSNLAQLVLSGDLSTVFVDNVYFYNSGEEIAAESPASAAPAPIRDASKVLSIFSDTYENLAGTNLNPDWGQGTSVSQVSIDDNNTLLYTGLNFQGTEFASAIDASSMTHIHLDYWTANSTLLNWSLISPGPMETASSLAVPTEGWVSVDIPLSDFTAVDLSNIIQYKFDGNGTIYLDNIYFYEEVEVETEPSSSAPEPSQDSLNVISIFSDAYTNVDGTNLNPGWGQGTMASEILIDGNNTLQYLGLDFQGIELGSNQDVSEMSTLHIDFWSANSNDLSIFLISPGPVETAVKLTVPTNGWSSIDIPLADFSPVALNDIFQLKFVGNGDIYIDNLFFFK
jgi:hypothetical protein